MRCSSRHPPKAQAPWTLVDFNDQRRGRLALIRDLLARVPDTAVAPEPLVMAPLAGRPGVELLPPGIPAI